jgi:FdhE protein
VTQPFATRLRDLADQDPAVAPLARLQAEALEAASDPAWRAAVPELASQPPLLDGTTIRLDAHRVHDLFERLGANVTAPLALLEASLAQDAERLLRAAQGEAASGLTPNALVVIAQVASLPLLLACGAESASRVNGLVWEHGSCPVCAAWPTLLEIRGLERQRWLRCGRCGTGWQQINALCAFCGSNEYRRQAYLAPEKERESRQALICHDCRGYLKAFTTLGPLDPGEVLLRDLLSLELDVAALEPGYARPDQPPTRLDVRVEPVGAPLSRR